MISIGLKEFATVKLSIITDTVNEYKAVRDYLCHGYFIFASTPAKNFVHCYLL